MAMHTTVSPAASHSPSADTSLSKLLSLILRHRPQDFGVTLTSEGWASVDAVLAALEAAGHPSDRVRLGEIVRTNDKHRFALSDDGLRIRANQGHSVRVDLGHPSVTPPPRLYHGTISKFLSAIRTAGLVRGRRHHVHLSTSVGQAEIVGRRRGRPLVIEVLAAEMAAAGYVFLLSPNGVWLTSHVPPRFLIVLEP
jgi:putative RNA 2'-phosphotransferase